MKQPVMWCQHQKLGAAPNRRSSRWAPPSPPTPDLVDSPTTKDKPNPLKKLLHSILSIKKAKRKGSGTRVTFASLATTVLKQYSNNKDLSGTTLQEATESSGVHAVDLATAFNQLGLDGFEEAQDDDDNFFGYGGDDASDEAPGFGVEESKEEVQENKEEEEFCVMLDVTDASIELVRDRTTTQVLQHLGWKKCASGAH